MSITRPRHTPEEMSVAELVRVKFITGVVIGGVKVKRGVWYQRVDWSEHFIRAADHGQLRFRVKEKNSRLVIGCTSDVEGTHRSARQGSLEHKGYVCIHNGSKRQERVGEWVEMRAIPQKVWGHRRVVVRGNHVHFKHNVDSAHCPILV